MSIEGPRGASAAELDAVVALADSVFRPGAESSMREEFPLLFREENAENLRIFADGASVVAHVGMLLREVSLLGMRHLCCCVGSVCTDPEYRGQGLATRLLEDARQRAVRQGADIFLVSGGRGLYRRFGFVDVGSYGIYTVKRRQLPGEGGYALRSWRPGDLAALVRIHAAEPVRFIRTPEDFLAFLQTGKVACVAGDTVVVVPKGSDQPVAYMCCQFGSAPWERKQDEDAISVREVAGPRWALAHGMRLLLQERGAARLDLHHLGSDVEMAALAVGLGWRGEERGFPGTVGIVDPLRFWEACAPLFAERLGPERAERLQLDAADTLRLCYGDNELVLDGMGAFTRLVFLPRHRRRDLKLDRRSALTAVLDELFPLPLVDYGLNYI
ncbi:MAG: GNAT family N-acetyltransferase [Planctomycetota bacterium]|jgi:predicted N-acetyltransferase YhbS